MTSLEAICTTLAQIAPLRLAESWDNVGLLVGDRKQTVDRVMAFRKHDRPFQVAFHGRIGPAEWLAPETPETLKRMAGEGHTSILVVPVALVTEHLETTYALDIELRDQAARVGITHFEVMPALNCHSLFIEAEPIPRKDFGEHM